MLGRRNRTIEDHTWWEEPCSSFRNEIDRRIEKKAGKAEERSDGRYKTFNTDLHSGMWHIFIHYGMDPGIAK